MTISTLMDRLIRHPKLLVAHGSTGLVGLTVRPPMLWILVSSAVVSGGSFLFYGFETLFADPPRGEYERFGMSQLRRFVGVTQLLGGAGVLIGLVYAPLGAAAAAGLTVMMVLGLLTRLRVHDMPRLMIPAGTFAVINATLVVLFLMR